MTLANEEKPSILPPESGPSNEAPAAASQPSQGDSKAQPPLAGPPPYAAGEPCSTPANGGGRLAQKLHDAAMPVNNWAVRMGTEPFLTMPMELECDKAARILQSFCVDGIYRTPTPSQGMSTPILAIPSSVIAQAVGLAIFTTARVGFHVSGMTGSGVLIARRADGSWSPPSGFTVYGLGAGLTYGAEVSDCVAVIRTREALEAFVGGNPLWDETAPPEQRRHRHRGRLAFGPDLAVVAGPVGAGAAADFAIPVGEGHKHHHCHKHHWHGHHKNDDAAAQQQPQEQQAQPAGTPGPHYHREALNTALHNPVYRYSRSRGLFLGLQLAGTYTSERREANQAFYGLPVAAPTDVDDPAIATNILLRQNVEAEIERRGGRIPEAATRLLEVVRGAEGIART